MDPGVVRGSFVLVGGDPGIGKSTLMLQVGGREVGGGEGEGRERDREGGIDKGTLMLQVGGERQRGGLQAHAAGGGG